MRNITLGTLKINEQGRKYVNDALDNNRLSRGPYTERFEKEFARLHECKHAIFLNSGTSALQVALAALKEIHDYAEGDEVIVPATTFIATSNIVLQNGLVPIFVDVDSETFNIDPLKIEEKITSRTKAIIPVHLFGLPADMGAIMEIAIKYNLQVIEDSCETMLATCYGKSVGSFGDAGCFSTYIAHLVVGGVGGLITTNDDKIAEISRSLMCHGRDSIYTNIDQDDNASDALLKKMIERRYSFDRVGFSYRATEIEAAIALSELEIAGINITRRKENAKHLSANLADLWEFIQTPVTPIGYDHSFMMYAGLLADDVDRDKFLLFLEQNGIETRLLFPLLETPIYRKLFPGLEHQYPVAKKLAKQGFFIGIHQNLTFSDIGYISDVIHKYFKESV